MNRFNKGNRQEGEKKVIISTNFRISLWCYCLWALKVRMVCSKCGQQTSLDILTAWQNKRLKTDTHPIFSLSDERILSSLLESFMDYSVSWLICVNLKNVWIFFSSWHSSMLNYTGYNTFTFKRFHNLVPSPFYHLKKKQISWNLAYLLFTLLVSSLFERVFFGFSF